MKKEELDEKLRLHKMWVKYEQGGQRANLLGADLRGADLQGAYLQGADLQRANLQGADLLGADLQGADLLGANLQGANLQGANLRGADLRGAYLRGAKQILSFGPMPTSGRMVYAVKHDDGWKVQAGCFWGTVDELELKVKAKHNCPVYLGVIAILRNYRP